MNYNTSIEYSLAQDSMPRNLGFGSIGINHVANQEALYIKNTNGSLVNLHQPDYLPFDDIRERPIGSTTTDTIINPDAIELWIIGLLNHPTFYARQNRSNAEPLYSTKWSTNNGLKNYKDSIFYQDADNDFTPFNSKMYKCRSNNLFYFIDGSDVSSFVSWDGECSFPIIPFDSFMRINLGINAPEPPDANPVENSSKVPDKIIHYNGKFYGKCTEMVANGSGIMQEQIVYYSAWKGSDLYRDVNGNPLESVLYAVNPKTAFTPSTLYVYCPGWEYPDLPTNAHQTIRDDTSMVPLTEALRATSVLKHALFDKHIMSDANDFDSGCREHIFVIPSDSEVQTYNFSDIIYFSDSNAYIQAQNIPSCGLRISIINASENSHNILLPIISYNSVSHKIAKPTDSDPYKVYHFDGVGSSVIIEIKEFKSDIRQSQERFVTYTLNGMTQQ